MRPLFDKQDVMKTEGWKEVSKSLVEEVLAFTVDLSTKRQKLYHEL